MEEIVTRIMLIVGVLIVIALTVVFLNGNKNQPESNLHSLTFTEVQGDIAKGAVMYDVRTLAEYIDGHFENAKNFNVEDMLAGKLPDVSKDKKIYVYCHSGNRSSRAASALKAAGFTDINDLGGLSKVQSIGGKLIK